MEEVVCRHMGSIAQNLGTVQNYINFLDIPDREGEDIDLNKDCDIRVDGVSFSYPGGETPALEGVSFTIRRGETTAIVGENGAGKSTLVRLITGLYLPDKGRVYHGDVDTAKVSTKKLYKNISGVFQKYQRYQLTLGENIGISDTDLEPHGEYLDMVSAMANLDPKNKSFTQGYETILSREFGGVDISGGQWQRVAILEASSGPIAL